MEICEEELAPTQLVSLESPFKKEKKKESTLIDRWTGTMYILNLV